MDATAWTVVGAAIAILVAIGASFRSLRDELRELGVQGKETSEQISRLRERMAHLESLLEGLREAVTGKRVA